MSSSPVRSSSPGAVADSSSPVVYNTPGSTPSRTPRTPRSVSSHVPRSVSSHIPRTPTSATPRRSELGSASRHHVVPVSSGGDEKVSSSSDHADPVSRSVIWGTTVSVQDSMNKFMKFFEEHLDERTGEPLYPQLLRETLEEDVHHINLNCKNLYDYDMDLYRQLVFYPAEIIPIFDMCIDRITQNQFREFAENGERVQVRTFNLIDVKSMRELDPKDIDTMVAIKGMVIRCSGIIPDMMSAYFQCVNCGHSEEVHIDRGRIDEPTTCANCKAKHSMQIIHNRCQFSDKQVLKIQETPDSIPQGETPHTVTVYAFGDLVDVAKPGDRVEITGIFKAKAKRVSSRQRAQHSLFDTYIDVLHIKKTVKTRFGAEDSRAEKESEYYTSFEESDNVVSISAERKKELKKLAEDPDIYQKLAGSIAPSIFEMDNVKKGILCQLFSGANKQFAKGQRDGFRGEINVLLCGDPGVSKSQLLQYVHKLAPRGIYTSGKGSSAVGLTAYVTKDPMTGEMVLESGALVLSDRGVCCIDEFDKMNESTRSILHEVMEQQTVSIAKAGIVCTLNARTSILASANPVGSRYDTSKSVVANINLLPTILSRFDLIYLILDNPSEAHDRRLAKHLISMYAKEGKEKAKGTIPIDVLTDYITYARMNIHPKISEEASEALVTTYVNMRKVGRKNGQSNVVTATTRQLESLIRLAEALAKMRLSDVVTKENVEEAARLINVATQTAATDPNTGLIDMDLITTGTSAGDRKRLTEITEAIKELLDQQKKRNLSFDDILKSLNENSAAGVKRNDLLKILPALKDDGILVNYDKRKETVRLA